MNCEICNTQMNHKLIEIDDLTTLEEYWCDKDGFTFTDIVGAMCVQCGKSLAYRYKGKQYKLCATCALDAIGEAIANVDLQESDTPPPPNFTQIIWGLPKIPKE